MSSATPITVLGSSPHARGAPRPHGLHGGRVGIIPACAGSTGLPGKRKAGRWDHPRMRGEHTTHVAANGNQLGSSPHARGARLLHARRRRDGGIIPACAGSTAPYATEGKLDWDHPRMRGEHNLRTYWSWWQLGSSPHARGAPAREKRFVDVVGIIPACAGSTIRAAPPVGGAGDHPRMRGEHGRLKRLAEAWAGSSPHARGALAHLVAREGHHGIIPACAGSTDPRRGGLAGCRDHPRMRGEHIDAIKGFFNFKGSSPHARGAHDAQLRGIARHGIIPACAGSTE